MIKRAHKFTKGDIIRCITQDGASGGYIYGETYEVKRVYFEGAHERVNTVVDSDGSKRNGWGVEHFTLVGEPKKAATVLGTQVGGSHYTDCAIQPIEYIWANKLGFSEGNIIKYVTRWRSKGGVKDLEKAKHHIALLIEHTLASEAEEAK